MIFAVIFAVLGGIAAILGGFALCMISASRQDLILSCADGSINPAKGMLVGILLAVLGLCSMVCGFDLSLRLSADSRAQKLAAGAAGEDKR